MPQQTPKTRDQRRNDAIATAEANACHYYPNEERIQNVYVSGFMHGFGHASNDDQQIKTVSDVEAAGIVLKKLADVLEFIDAVREMRFAQRSFFKERKNGSPKTAQEWLQRSKGFETKVDQLLAKFEGRADAARKSNNQQSLF